jgi:hypothetical protein
VQIIGAFLKISIDQLRRVIGQILECKQEFEKFIFQKQSNNKFGNLSARRLYGNRKVIV